MKCQTTVILISAELVFDKLSGRAANYNARRLYEYISEIRRSSPDRAAKCKRPLLDPGITLHLDCTKIYLLILMVACRHRHASVKAVGINKETLSRKITRASSPSPPFVQYNEL